MVIPIVTDALGTLIKRLEETGGLGNKRMSGDHLKYRIVEIGQNAEKSPGDFMSLKLPWKTLKREGKDNNNWIETIQITS